MTTLEIVLSILGGCGVLASIYFGVKAYRRNNRQDDTGEGHSKGVILTEIGYIKSGIDDIKREQSCQRENYVQVVSRLATVEASAKQAHHQIDGLEQRRE